MKSRKTKRDDQKPSRLITIDVTGMHIYPAQGKEVHSYFKKGGKFNP